MLFISASLALMLMSFRAGAAGFNCKLARSQTEQRICADPALSSLDARLARAYRAHLQRHLDELAAQDEQRRWLRRRDACPDAACLAWMYERRIVELEGRRPIYLAVRGAEQTLCAAIERAMNRRLAEPLSGPACGIEVVTGLDGVDLPALEVLDLAQHKSLYKRFALHLIATPQELVRGVDRVLADKDAELEARWQRAVARRHQFYRWKSPAGTADPTDVEFIEVGRRDAPDEQCPDVWSWVFPADMGTPRFETVAWRSRRLPITHQGQIYWLGLEEDRSGLPRSGSVTVARGAYEAGRGAEQMCSIVLSP